MRRTSAEMRGFLAKGLAMLGVALTLTSGGAASAQDAAAGEAVFKKCKACHSVIAPDGTALQKGGKTGPNLYGVIGRPIASDPGFAYGDAIAAVGGTGAVWDEAALAAYVADPGAWLKAALGDDGAKSKMTFKLAEGGGDVAAYLAAAR